MISRKSGSVIEKKDPNTLTLGLMLIFVFDWPSLYTKLLLLDTVQHIAYDHRITNLLAGDIYYHTVDQIIIGFLGNTIFIFIFLQYKKGNN